MLNYSPTPRSQSLTFERTWELLELQDHPQHPYSLHPRAWGFADEDPRKQCQKLNMWLVQMLQVLGWAKTLGLGFCLVADSR